MYCVKYICDVFLIRNKVFVSFLSLLGRVVIIAKGFLKLPNLHSRFNSRQQLAIADVIADVI